MAKLPEQVQRALDEADQIEQGLQAPPPDPDPAAPPALEPEPLAPAEPPPPPAQPPSDEPSWEQKYRTLQGVHRVDLDRLNGEIDRLKGEVQTLRQAATKPAEPQPAEPQPAKKLITDSDVEAFGPDMIDVIRRAAAEIAEPIQAELDRVKAENAQLKGTVETVASTQTNVTHQTFLQHLGQKVSDWETLNTNPAFLLWLGEKDPLSGLDRQTLLTAAVNEQDVDRAARFFETWKSLQAPPPPPAADPKADLRLQVQPPSSNGQPPVEPTPVKQWTPKSIEDHYNALARGEFRGREAEAERIEQDIDRWLQTTHAPA